jgi:hypothetical protein
MEILGSSTVYLIVILKNKKVLPGINWTSIEIMENILFDSETLHDHKKEMPTNMYRRHEENCIPLVSALIYYYDDDEEKRNCSFARSSSYSSVV